jgi:hypothetical protein
MTRLITPACLLSFALPWRVSTPKEQAFFYGFEARRGNDIQVPG